MPIYTYKCTVCGKVFEKFKNMSSNGKEYCQYCSSEALRVFTPAGIIFKGSGFYTTDYKTNQNKSSSIDPLQKKAKEDKVENKIPDSSSSKNSELIEKSTKVTNKKEV